MSRGKPRIPIEERFWTKVNIKGPDDCWLWTACITKGYGRIGDRGDGDGKQVMKAAHRMAWELTHGPITNGLWALHKCDVTICCNPKHLYLGTHQDNMDDKVSRDRCSRGETHPDAKLTEEVVKEIRLKHSHGSTTLKELGLLFGTPWQTVYDVVSRHTWKHVA